MFDDAELAARVSGVIYRAIYGIVADAPPAMSADQSPGRYLPPEVAICIREWDWDRNPAAMELVRRAVEDALEGRSPRW